MQKMRGVMERQNKVTIKIDLISALKSLDSQISNTRPISTIAYLDRFLS